MATNPTGVTPPRPPPPSARDTKKESSGRLARRTSNRPPAKSVFRASATSGERHAVDPSLWESAPSRAPSPAPSAQVNTRELRDELVRALMPELRTLVEHMVSVATDRSLAPLLERQRELQASLGRSGARDSSPDLDAAVTRALAPLLERQRALEAALAELQQRPPAAKAGGVAPRFAEPFVSPGSAQVETQAWVASPAKALPSDAVLESARRAPLKAAAIGGAGFDTTPWADIPSELNGSRRKRIVLWLLAIGVLALIGTAVGLSVMSNAAAQF